MMYCRSHGRIFNPEVSLPKGYSHASCPVGFYIGERNQLRVFFSSRDVNQRSHVFFADYDIEGNRFTLVSVSPTPILSPGALGLFDCDGISTGSIIAVDNELWLYYVGWQLQKSVPWMNTIGLAKSKDFGLSFEKVGRVPIMDRSEEDPFSMSYPWVEVVNKQFIMWYGSNQKWGKDKSEMEHVLKRATSYNGLHWMREETTVFYNLKQKPDMSRPSVLRNHESLYMLFSVKDSFGMYYINSAHSTDGENWKLEKVSIDIRNEWDSDERCYPSFFTHSKKVFALYNGNGYGKSGFGLLELEP